MIPVQSSNIKEIGFDAVKQRLFLTMKNSKTVYVYANFLESMFNAFLESESKGKFFLNEIKGKFSYEKFPTEK